MLHPESLDCPAFQVDKWGEPVLFRGSNIGKGKVGSEKGRKSGKTSTSLSCSRWALLLSGLCLQSAADLEKSDAGWELLPFSFTWLVLYPSNQERQRCFCLFIFPEGKIKTWILSSPCFWFSSLNIHDGLGNLQMDNSPFCPYWSVCLNFHELWAAVSPPREGGRERRLGVGSTGAWYRNKREACLFFCLFNFLPPSPSQPLPWWESSTLFPWVSFVLPMYSLSCH